MGQQQPNPGGLGGMLPPEWSYRVKGAQFGFIAGILIGLILGWIFHSVISFAFQIGLVIFLLIPLVIIGWLWFRSQRAPRAAHPSDRPGDPGAGGWATVIDVRTVETMTPPRREANITEARARETEFVDVPLVKPTPAQAPLDVEAELEALKRSQGGGS